MNPDEPFRTITIAGAVVLIPFMLYHRIRSQATGEKLDRWQEGRFILFTLRPVAFAYVFGLFAFMIRPASMQWSSLPLPAWLRWVGIGLAVAAGLLLAWTVPTLGKNLTDTVVTRQAATLVTTGPYRWVRHPFYVAMLLALLGNSLVAADWFMMLTGALVFSLMVIRTRTEEEKLLAKFGDAYRAYMDRTGRFLPRIGEKS